MLTVKDIRIRKEQIFARFPQKGIYISPSTAWTLLMEDVLVAIAQGDEDPKALASALLTP